MGADHALQTIPSIDGNEFARHQLLEEDYDEEMSTLQPGIHPRVTNYEYAQTQEEKQIKNIVENMPEAQFVNTYMTLNQ